MPIKQIINYNSDNTYFAGFLQTIINDSQINASVDQKNNKIELLIDTTDEKKLEWFNENLAKYLPHSIFLGEIETLNSDEKIVQSNFQSDDYNIAPCPKCLELIQDPSSQYYLDESLQCTHYNNKGKIYQDFTIYSPHYSKNSAVLITNSEKIDELFILTDDEIKALFSIEKPTIKATIKDETLKNLTGKNYIFIKAPYNNRSLLASTNAKESGVDYLFFEDTNDLKVIVVQQNKTIIKASRIAKELEALNDDSVLNRFLNISKEAGFNQSAIGANLSLDGISFIVSNEVGIKEVIQFQEFNLDTMLEQFKVDSKRVKLLENFSKKYPNIVEEFENNSNLNLFETIAAILELKEKDFEAVCDKGYEFRGNGGLKIDTNFNEDGFDYSGFIGSIISFKLAGVEEHYLAYSIFEALADMSITTLNQLKEKFKIQNILMMGDIFENSVLYSRILSKFQLSNPYFSKDIALNE
ncbi:MAG: hydrogenase [Arcobacteraceae bacterium]|nr:hydrogenase [Arcobacteraceae bacterium]